MRGSAIDRRARPVAPLGRDAAVGGPFAAPKNARLLLTVGSALPDATKAELERVLPAGGTVYILGSTQAVPASVEAQLKALGYVTVRYGGVDRYATAVAVADALGDPSTVLLATGINFPDALAAASAAAKAGGVVLLTNGTSLPSATSAYLRAHPGTVYAVGGPAVAADPGAVALAGIDRFATAVAVATRFFPAPTAVGIATGYNFPDALAGSALLASVGVPLLLAATTSLPGSTADYLASVKATATTAHLFGDPKALSAQVETAVDAALGITP